MVNKDKEMDIKDIEMAKRILLWANGNKAPPYLINFYYTKRCNLKCQFCNYSGIDIKIDHSNELTKEELLRFTKEGCEFGIKYWFLAGGEPFFHTNTLLEMMTIIKKHKCFGNVNTNGILVNKKVSKKLVELKWDIITFSLNSHTAKIDDYLRGIPNTFNKCVSNIKQLSKIKENNKSLFPDIGIHSVITNKNHNKISEMIKFAHSLNVTSLNFTHLMNDTTLSEKLMLNSNQIKEFNEETKKAFKLANKLRIFTNLSSYIDSDYNDSIGSYHNILTKKILKKNKKNVLSSVCFEPWKEISVFYDGSVGPCGNWDPKNSTENIKQKSIKEIWYGKSFNKIREKFVSENYDKICEDCASSRIYRNEEIKKVIKKMLS